MVPRWLVGSLARWLVGSLARGRAGESCQSGNDKNLVGCELSELKADEIRTFVGRRAKREERNYWRTILRRFGVPLLS
jgi:hypothetical protein